MARGAENERRLLSLYLREIRRFPTLSLDDERRLLRQVARGEPGAAGRLVESNLGFVVKIAAEYRSLGVPFEDLLNEGNLGLLEAAGRFDPGKGAKFITYAIWWIRKSILKSIADRSLVVRVPAYRRKKLYALKQAESSLRRELGREPTREEVARELSLTAQQVDDLRRHSLSHVSLDASAGAEQSRPLLDLVRDSRRSAEERLLLEESRALMGRAFRSLSGRERAVLGWRFALDGQPPMTLRQIGEKMGLSRERVRQIESQAKHRLRRFFSAKWRASVRAR